MQPALAPRISPSGNMSLPHVTQDHGLTERSLIREQYMPPHTDHLDNMSHQSSAPMPQDSPVDGNTGSPESDGGDGTIDGRKGYGKRELSTSKRAAQNRAAQRAFRQRKEGYIKKLEEQVRDYQILSENFKAVQAENYQLRDYIINLQSRLLESQGEVPPPPSNVDGLQPGKSSSTPSSQTATLPRLSELGAVGSQSDSSMSGVSQHHETPRSSYPDPSYSDPKRLRTSAEMNPSQAALQGASILAGSSNGSR